MEINTALLSRGRQVAALPPPVSFLTRNFVIAQESMYPFRRSLMIRTILCALLNASLLAAGSVALAQSISIGNNGPAGVGPGMSSNIAVTASGTGIHGISLRLCYDPTQLTAGTPVVSAGLAGVVCAPPANTTQCPGSSPPFFENSIACADVLAPGATFMLPADITFPFTVNPTATAGDKPLRFATGLLAPAMFDLNTVAIATTTSSPGFFRVTGGGTGDVAPLVVYNPPPDLPESPPGTVNIAGSVPAGQPLSRNIVATPGNGAGAGSTTVGSCAFAGAAAANFAVTSAQPLTFTGATTTPQNLALRCLTTAVAQSAALTCTEIRSSGAPFPRRWDVNCPAGGSGTVVGASAVPALGEASRLALLGLLVSVGLFALGMRRH